MPFIQVHHSVGAKAAALAPVLKVTYQHARGGLDVWWEGLADRRILGGKLELVLSEDEVATRLELAFGVPVGLPIMVRLGFLEPRAGGFRIRGMSRYLVAEATRLKRKGGQAAPETDPGPPPMAPEHHPGGTPSATPVPPPVAPPVPPGSDPTEERGKRREVRGESTDESGDAFFAWTQDSRVDRGHVREAPPLVGLSAWFSTAMMEVGGDFDRLKAGWLAYLGDPYWKPRKNPWAGWLKKWRECCPSKSVSAPVATCTVCGESLLTGACGSAEVPLCWAHWHEAQEWCASQRIDMWEQGGLEKWNTKRLQS